MRFKEEAKDLKVEFSLAATLVLGAGLLFLANTDGAGDFRWRYMFLTLLYAMAAAAVLHLLQRRKAVGLRAPSLVLLGTLSALLAFGLASFAWSGSAFRSLDAVQLLALFLVAFFLGRFLLRGIREARLFMAMVTASATALCLYGIMQYFFFFEKLVLFLRQHDLDYAITDRINSRFVSPNVFASFLNLAWPMALALLLTEGRKALRWLWGFALTTELTCLYLTESRGGWMVFALVAVSIALLMPRRAWRGKAAVIVIALSLTAVACVLCSFYSPLGGEKYAAVDGSASGGEYSGLDVTAAAGSMRGRVGIWRGGIEMFRGNLLSGVGAGDFGLAMQRYQHRAFYSVHAHDYLLETGAELGILGLALALLLTALVLSRVKGARAAGKAGREGFLAVSLWAACAGFIAHNLVDISWFSPLCAAVFWLSAGALFALTEGVGYGKEAVPVDGAGHGSAEILGRDEERTAYPGKGYSGPSMEGGESGARGGERPFGLRETLEEESGDRGGGKVKTNPRDKTPNDTARGRVLETDDVEAGKAGRIKPAFLLACALAVALVVVTAFLNARLFLSTSARDRADEADTVGEEELAVEEYEKALRYWETDPSTHQQLGYVLQGIMVYGEMGQAEREELSNNSLFHLDRAIRLEPDNAYAHLWKGTLLLNLDRHDEGRAALREAGRLYPNNPAPPFFEGESFYAQGDYEAALEAFSRALRLTPYYADVNIVPFRGRPEFRYIISSVMRSTDILLRQERGQEALEVVDKALSWLPDNPTLHYYRAYVLKETGDPSGALLGLDAVEELLPGCSGVHLMRGIIYQESGESEKAREEFLRELEINPNNVEARERLESLELKQGG